jgi:hypothetical protein
MTVDIINGIISSNLLIYHIKLHMQRENIILVEFVDQLELLCRIWGSHSGGYEECYIPEYNAV